jgi:hypothetical protein
MAYLALSKDEKYGEFKLSKTDTSYAFRADFDDLIATKTDKGCDVWLWLSACDMKPFGDKQPTIPGLFFLRLKRGENKMENAVIDKLLALDPAKAWRGFMTINESMCKGLDDAVVSGLITSLSRFDEAPEQKIDRAAMPSAPKEYGAKEYKTPLQKAEEKLEALTKINDKVVQLDLFAQLAATIGEPLTQQQKLDCLLSIVS